MRIALTELDLHRALKSQHRPSCTTQATDIFAGKLPICTMLPTSAEIVPTFYGWNNRAVAEHEIDKAAVLARAMALLERPEDNVQWSL